MQNTRVKKTYHSYFRFNNQRTLSTHLPSELSVLELQEITFYIDSTRRYDNQVIIHDLCDLDKFESGLSQYDSKCSPEVCIEPAANSQELNQWLENQGFCHIYDHEFLQMFSEDFTPSDESANAVSVELWGAEKADDFLALLKTSGLTCSSDIWEQKRSLYCTETFRCFVASVNGKACAWATSFIDGDHAILANAYTQEDARGQGCQTALLNARAKDAIDLGVKVLLTDVMLGSISSKNCQSIGFSRSGLRAVWGKE